MRHPTEDKDEDFIIYRTISGFRGEVIRGRGTRVFLAWLAAEVRDKELDASKREVILPCFFIVVISILTSSARYSSSKIPGETNDAC